MNRRLAVILPAALFIAVCLRQDCRAQGQGRVYLWDDRMKIVVLRENAETIELAPGEIIALAGTQFSSSPKFDLSGCEGGVTGCTVIRGYGSSEGKWAEWNLAGISALSEGTAEVTLTPKDGGAGRKIKVTVKKHPEGWKDKLQSALKETRVSVEFKDASVEDVADELSKKTKIRFDSDYFIDGTRKKVITYSCTDKTVSEVLDSCLKPAGFDRVLKNNRVLLTVTSTKVYIELMPYAVESLRWLHFHRSKDGGFRSAKFSDNCRREPKCTGPGDAGRDVATSGLALLAFLGQGHTHRIGQFKGTVRKVKEYLTVGQQNDDGTFGELKGTMPMFDTFLGTMSITEMYAVTRDATLRQPCLKALDIVLKAQNKDGGWAWEKEGGRSNTLATAFAVFALKAAKTGGFEFPQAAFDNAVKFFISVTDENGRAGYEAKGDKKTPFGGEEKQPACTAASIIASVFSGVNRREDRIVKGAGLLLENLPDPGEADPVYMYFASYALFQYGGKRWKAWFPKMAGVLMAGQDMEGCASGSWKPRGEWAKFGGRMFLTALNVMTSEIFLRYGRANVSFEDSTEEK